MSFEGNEGRLPVDGLEWNHGAREALGPEWSLHVLPIEEVNYRHSEWEQIGPIPVFRKTENFDDGFRFEYIVYQTDLGRQHK